MREDPQWSEKKKARSSGKVRTSGHHVANIINGPTPDELSVRAETVLLP